jgi:hypothetical protein
MIDNEVVKAVPVIGTAVKLLKGVDDMRSRMLAAKLSRFLSEPSLRDALEGRSLRNDMLKTTSKDEEIGATLFMIIDKVTDMNKPVLLSKLFAAYLDQLFDRDFFLILVHAVDLSAIGDLQEMVSSGRNQVLDTGREPASHESTVRMLRLERLASSGLYRSRINMEFPHNLQYHLSPVGSAFLAAIEHCSRNE